MLTLRTLAIVLTVAGIFAGLPLTDTRACDDDRYPLSRRRRQKLIPQWSRRRVRMNLSMANVETKVW